MSSTGESCMAAVRMLNQCLIDLLHRRQVDPAASAPRDRPGQHVVTVDEHRRRKDSAAPMLAKRPS
jgi:hypothetical protein